jgi:sialate O-acetylesterase
MKRITLIFVFLTFCTASVKSEVKLPSIFGNNMVLQREIPCPVWGWADAGEEISVSIAGQTKSTKTNADGKWSVKLDPLKVGKPLTMKIKGRKNVINFENVQVGEVWIGSGQSNMNYGLGNTIDSKNVIENANYPDIRLVTIPNVAQKEPQDNCNCQWVECSPATVKWFSAVLFYFGHKIHKDINVPVGLIHCSWGGSSCEAWVNEKVLANEPIYNGIFERRKIFNPEDPNLRISHQVGYLYNGMVRPIVGYGIRGVLWYQGETNGDNLPKAREYTVLFPELIRDWRAQWGVDFPFLFVQLASYRAPAKTPSEGNWAWVREAQLRALSLPETGMASALDLGDADDIHPRNKFDVAKRLSLVARHVAYGETLVHSGPVYDSSRVEGRAIRVAFRQCGGGLMAGIGKKPGVELSGFGIAGADRKFVRASAVIEGDTVFVSSESVPDPVSVRYGWADNPSANLYNKEGLPASPFRTDDW